MVTKEDLVYRQVYTLKDGTRVLVRPLNKDDRQALLDLFLPVGPDERRYMRDNVNDPVVVNGWIDELDYKKVMPLVALVGNRIVGTATLHFRPGPARHRAESRIYLAKDFRQRGVGSRMLQGLVEVARKLGLHFIEVEIVSDQSFMIKAFQSVGFETKCIFEDHFMLPDGETRDVALMILRLHKTDSEF